MSNCPPLADNRGTQRSAIPFVEEGKAFFDKLKFAGVLFSLMLSAMLRQDYEPDAVLEIVRRTLY